MNEKEKRLTARKILRKHTWKLFVVGSVNEFESSVIRAMKQYANQEAKAKDREWREKIQKRWNEVAEPDHWNNHTNRVVQREVLFELDNLLKGG